MLHNHKDKDSQPIDNLNPEMQAQWDMLMAQCFPQFAKDRRSLRTYPFCLFEYAVNWKLCTITSPW